MCLTHIDLFSGIGGFALAAQANGFKTIVFCEQDEFCQQVLNKHWPETPIIPDIRDFDGTKYRGATLLSGGFPCQDISIANARPEGLGGARSGLWFEMFRVVCEARPSFVIVENVAILTRRGIERVLGDLASIRYDAEWALLRAEDFGVPQARPRIFIVAYPTSSCPFEIFHKNTFNVKGNKARLDVESRKTSDVDNQNNRKSALSILGDPNGRTIPHGERSGTDDGIPNRVDRLKALGNAIVPQVAYEIIKGIKCLT